MRCNDDDAMMVTLMAMISDETPNSHICFENII